MLIKKAERVKSAYLQVQSSGEKLTGCSSCKQQTNKWQKELCVTENNAKKKLRMS